MQKPYDEIGNIHDYLLMDSETFQLYSKEEFADENIRDRLIPIDKEISELIVKFNKYGFTTEFSCIGGDVEITDDGGMAYNAPYIQLSIISVEKLESIFKTIINNIEYSKWIRFELEYRDNGYNIRFTTSYTIEDKFLSYDSIVDDNEKIKTQAKLLSKEWVKIMDQMVESIC